MKLLRNPCSFLDLELQNLFGGGGGRHFLGVPFATRDLVFLPEFLLLPSLFSVSQVFIYTH